MSKVYIVRGYDEDHGDRDLAVYSSKKQANAHLNDLNDYTNRYNTVIKANNYVSNRESIKLNQRIKGIGGDLIYFVHYHIYEVEIKEEYKRPWGK
jgi:hypothetical protein